MTLRGRFIALTYDHQIAKVEKAGLGAALTLPHTRAVGSWRSAPERAPTCASTVRPSNR